jgi:tetratricopeptide (TPR) repeat protein
VIAPLLVLALAAAEAPPHPVARGLAALDGGHYEEAVQTLSGGAEARASYRAQVGLGQALGQLGRTAEAFSAYERALDLIRREPGTDGSYDALMAAGFAHAGLNCQAEAESAFRHATSLDPTRPAAWIEHGGLLFLLGDYAGAARDLRRALALTDDAYARNLLATSCFLAGRSFEALDHWNMLKRPTVRAVELVGIENTRGPFIRRVVGIRRGDLLRAADIRRAELRLSSLSIFSRITFRPLPLGSDQADLELAVLERHGFAASLREWLLTKAVDLADQRAQLRYTNLTGQGINLSAGYRWEARRPETTATIDWPRPLGLDASLRVMATRIRQRYSVEGEPRRRAEEWNVRLRRVVGPRTVADLSLRSSYRSFDRDVPNLPAGRMTGIEGGIETALLERGRFSVHGRARVLQTLPAGPSDVQVRRGEARLVCKLYLGPASDRESHVIALQSAAGLASRGTPVDFYFAAGASGDMEWPLRAHRQASASVMGTTALARQVSLLNIEWRRRLVKMAGFEGTVVAFWDIVRIPRWAVPEARGQGWYHDVGVGLRIGASQSGVFRLDIGHSLVDARKAITIGIGQSF